MYQVVFFYFHVSSILLIVNCIFLLNNVFYCVAILQNSVCLRYVNMLAIIACFTSLKYMVLKALDRAPSFLLIDLFYNISFIFWCIFLRNLRKHLFPPLDKTVDQFTFFVILDQLLHFYCLACICLYGLSYRVALLVNSMCFRYLGRTLLMILNKVFYIITFQLNWIPQIYCGRTLLSGLNNLPN